MSESTNTGTNTGATGATTGRVIVGIDGSECSAKALRWALDHAAVTGTTVHLVACWQRPLVFDAGGLGVAAPPDEELSHAADTWLSQTWQACAGPIDAATARGCAVTREVRLGAADLVLEEMSGECDLLVVGRHGHNAFQRLLGTTSRHVADHARCAVVVVPEA